MRVRVALCILLLLSCFWFGYHQGSSKVQAELDQYVATIAQSNASAQAQLSTSFQQTLERRQRELQDITTQRDALLSRLRDRPSRETSARAEGRGKGSEAPSVASATACGPEQLYREDAEFLAGLAADAETVRVELLNTRAAYEKAGKVLADAP